MSSTRTARRLDRISIDPTAPSVTWNGGVADGDTSSSDEVTSTGGTSFRYDATVCQFIQSWQTSKGAGVRYRATMTTQAGTSLVALLKTK